MVFADVIQGLKFAAKMQLTPREIQMIAVLGDKQSWSMGYICQEMGISVMAATHVMLSLRDKKLAKLARRDNRGANYYELDVNQF